MTETQLLSAVSQIPIAALISLLTAISSRDYPQFTQLESHFVTQHGVEVWEEYFNFRLLPSLDKASSNWLLQQFIQRGTDNSAGDRGDRLRLLGGAAQS